MRCPNCNAWVGEDELFCGECGTRVVRPAPPPAAPPAAAEEGGAAKVLLGGGAAVVAIIGVVVVIVICLCLVVVVASGVLGPGPEPTITQVARATHTPTARVPTATPVRPTSTRPPSPTSRPSPTRPATPAATGGTFTDDFSDESGGWDLSTGTRGKSYIADGELHIEVTEKQSIVWSTRMADTWKDMVFEADARQVAGPDDNDYGFMFRYQDKQNFYRFVISGNGRYRVSKYVDGQWGTIVDWKSSAAIKKGVAKNHLKVVGRGDTFELYVNDEKVDTITDGDLDAGGIGLEVGSYDEAGVHVAFDNVRVSPAEVAFHEDFTDNRNTWPESDKAFLENGEYHIYDKESGHVFWNSTAGIHGDFTLEAKIRKVEGPDGQSYGIVFRLLDGDNYYVFLIRGDGRYRFDKQVDNKWESIIAAKKSDVVNEANRANVLRIVCKGQSFDFYINDQKVDGAQDSFLSEGKLGFFANPNVHMAVDYVTVWAEK